MSRQAAAKAAATADALEAFLRRRPVSGHARGRRAGILIAGHTGRVARGGRR